MNRPQRSAQPIRVLIVAKSPADREQLTRLFRSDGSFEVVGTASRGEEALSRLSSLKPQVMTIDLRLPDIDGIELTRRVMSEHPTPIVVLTENFEPDTTGFRALEVGALAVMRKPWGAPNPAAEEQALIRTVRSMAEVRLVRRYARRASGPTPEPARSPAPLAGRRPRVVAVGVSTGGPQTLQDIFTRLPSTFPLPILVVQHMADGFITHMVDWLATQCSLPVVLAEQNAPLDAPGIYVGPSGRHLTVSGGRILLADGPAIDGHKPSATVLFRSVVREFGADAVGVLLTGMGEDGAAGLMEMKKVGAVTIAQDEASSVIFGMPAAAIARGAADMVLPPPLIAQNLIRLGERNTSTR